MEGFLEANRLVEVSLSKLGTIHRSGDLPLRKTLLISKVLNRAQDLATSTHLTLVSSPVTTTPRSSSKLLASISKKVEYTSESDCLLTVPPRPVLKPPRQQSPIASRTVTRPEEDEPMDFESVSSVLSDILNDNESPAVSEMAESPRSEIPARSHHANKNEKIKHLGDISNTTKGWDSWQFDLNTDFTNAAWSTEPECLRSPPVSPGKRNHSEAFPFEKENSTIFLDGLDDSKRFKPSPPEGCPLESLPGFCGYLSPKNLQSAPLLTYMFGKGFALPSNPTTSDWPSHFTISHESELGLKEIVNQSFTQNHFPNSIQTSPVKFNAILAF